MGIGIGRNGIGRNGAEPCQHLEESLTWDISIRQLVNIVLIFTGCHNVVVVVSANLTQARFYSVINSLSANHAYP